MTKILPMTLFASVIAFSLNAQEEELTTIQRTVKSEVEQVADFESRALSKAAEASSSELNSQWIHHLAEVKDSGYQIVLEDDSIWSIGWFWHFRVNEWEPNDHIRVSYHLNTSSANRVLFHNITKDSIAWGNLYQNPSHTSPQILSIDSIENHFSTLVLNNGTKVSASVSGVFREWKEGDIVITCSIIEPPKPEKTPYALWNVTGQSIVWSLIVE